MDAFVRERAGCTAGRVAGLAGRSKAFVREELFCAQARCVVAVVGQGLQAAATAFFYAEELVLGAPAVAGGDAALRLAGAVAIGVIGVGSVGNTRDLRELVSLVVAIGERANRRAEARFQAIGACRWACGPCGGYDGLLDAPASCIKLPGGVRVLPMRLPLTS